MIVDTVNLSIELDSDYANFFTATAFPGTRYYDYAIEHNLFDNTDGANENTIFERAYAYPSVKGHYLSKEEIFELHEWAVKKFFFRPKYILKTFLKIRTLHQLKNYIRAAFKLIWLFR